MKRARTTTTRSTTRHHGNGVTSRVEAVERRVARLERQRKDDMRIARAELHRDRKARERDRERWKKAMKDLVDEVQAQLGKALLEFRGGMVEIAETRREIHDLAEKVENVATTLGRVPAVDEKLGQLLAHLAGPNPLPVPVTT